MNLWPLDLLKGDGFSLFLFSFLLFFSFMKVWNCGNDEHSEHGFLFVFSVAWMISTSCCRSTIFYGKPL